MIIDDAADLSEHAEVALLKTLEEPPIHAVLLLLTPTPARLLETIRSRLAPLPFRSGRRRPEIAERRSGKRFGADGRDVTRRPAAGRPGLAIALAATKSRERRADASRRSSTSSSGAD